MNNDDIYGDREHIDNVLGRIEYAHKGLKTELKKSRPCPAYVKEKCDLIARLTKELYAYE